MARFSQLIQRLGTSPGNFTIMLTLQYWQGTIRVLILSIIRTEQVDRAVTSWRFDIETSNFARWQNIIHIEWQGKWLFRRAKLPFCCGRSLGS